MKLSYYTIEQAARSLECEIDELEHFVFTGKLKARLYSNLKTFVVTKKVGDQYVGRGIAKYEGLVMAHESYFRRLLQKEKVIVENWMGLMQPMNIRSWHQNHGYNEDSFMKSIGISSWEPEELNNVREQTYLLAKAYPDEGPNPFSLINKTLETLAKNKGIEVEPSNPVPEFSYTYKQRDRYERDNIRITHNDLEQFRESQLEKTQQLEAANVSEKLFWHESKKRSTRIDPVIERLFRSNLKASAKTLWTLLEQDTEKEDPEFDINQIVRAIEGLALEWKNTKGSTSELTFKTFSNKISELRKFYKSLNTK